MFMGCFRELMDIDWTKPYYVLILMLFFIISRVPLLNSGFGTDADAWRIADSALDLNQFHIYHPSRFPGYPFPEFVNSLVINYGWLITNSLTMIISLISIIFFAKILKELNVKNKGLIVITYAFFPIIWIYSACTMDYMWALTFIIMAWYFIIKGNYKIAGLVMGLAIGSRITSILFIIPFIYYMIFTQKNEIKRILNFLIIAITTSLVLFLPLYLQYGIKFLSYYPSDISWILVFSDMNYYFGSLALLFGIVICLLSFKNLFGNLKKDKYLQFLLIIVIIYLILFIKVPFEIPYLIPIIPFGILLINEITNKKFFAILCVILLLNSFISFNILSTDSITNKGVVIYDNEFNAELTGLIQKINNNKIGNSVIIMGDYTPIFYYFNYNKLNGKNNETADKYWDSKRNILYTSSLNFSNVIKLQNKSYKVYYMGKYTLNFVKHEYGYELDKYNCSDIME